MARRVWRCLGCRIALGVIMGDTKLPDGRFVCGALSLDRSTASMVPEQDTYQNQAGTLVECQYCKRRKRWYGAVRS